MSRSSLANIVMACFALASCAVPDAGNPATGCDEASECMPDQVCYRGFCVENERQIDPVGAEDDAGLSTPDAAPPFDAAPEPVEDASAKDAATPPVKDAGAKDATVKDAGSNDASSKDAAVKDGGTKDAAVKDAGTPCAAECKMKNSGPCKKCVQDAFGDSLEELCGDKDDAKNPFCIALCLGNPGPKCGGTP